MVNTNLLRGKIASNGLTQQTLAEKLDISVNSISAKLRGKKPFKLSEVVRLCEILKIEDPAEKVEIFLT